MGKLFEKLVVLRLLIIQEFAIYTDVKTFCSNLKPEITFSTCHISMSGVSQTDILKNDEAEPDSEANSFRLSDLDQDIYNIH